MTISNKIIFTTFILFVGGIFLWAIFAPKEDISTQIHKTLKEQEKKADVIFKEVKFQEISSGKKYWDLLAQSAMLNKSTQIAALKSAKGTFYKNGKAVLLFRSPAALWDMKKKEIWLDKPLGKGAGFWFNANNLSWKFADQKLLCRGEIILNKGEVTAFCDKLESDVALEKAALQGNPRIIVAVNGRAPISNAKITCEKILYRQQDELIDLFGSVKISYQDITASGNSARYLTQGKIIILEGQAHAVQGGSRLSGDKVKVDLKENKISVIGKGKISVSEE
ncbi:MAG: LptA/OstA family protein [Candidatus Margulisbacteria bacterium]|nr:LptA/OstA family protein [Candidatus Margulisiibacteriota bacterium]